MKKITIIGCFVLISVLSTGAFLIHLSYLNSYRNDFRLFLKQTKDHSSRSIIYIHPFELYTNSERVCWKDNNKEIIYQGTLYDILQLKSEGTRIALIAVSDYQEMNLKKQFSDIYDSSFHGKTKSPYHLLKNFFSIKCIISNVGFEFKGLSHGLRTLISSDTFFISSGFLFKVLLPPDLFC